MDCSTTEAAGEIVTVGDYKVTGKLGGGGEVSAVWKAEHTTTGQVVALKQVHLSKLTRSLRNSLDCEIDFLSTVNHPNIVRLLDILKTKECIFMVFEFCAGGDLRSYIRQHGRVHIQIAQKFMQEIGAGLKLLSSHRIIHRDLKPENVLLTSPHSAAVLKIADFGLSRVRHPDDRIETVCGTPLYMAPEILQFQPYDDKVDMWSLGVILFELLHGYPPFHGRTNVQLLRNIMSCSSIPFSDLILPGLNLECVDMCSRLLSIKPEHKDLEVKVIQRNQIYNHVLEILAKTLDKGTLEEVGKRKFLLKFGSKSSQNLSTVLLADNQNSNVKHILFLSSVGDFHHIVAYCAWSLVFG